MNAEIKKMLDYQKVEAELIKIDREIDNNPNKITANKMVAAFKDSQKMAEMLEQEAKKSVLEFEKVKEVYEENFKRAEKLNNLDLDKLKEDDLLKLHDELEKVLSNLNIIEKKFISLNGRVEDILEKFEKAKQNVIAARSNYMAAKTALDKAVAGVAANREKFAIILSKLEGGINKNLMAKYQAARQDKIFPVIVPLSGGLCGGCRMQQPVIIMNKLNAQGFVECENCHRIIYVDE